MRKSVLVSVIFYVAFSSFSFAQDNLDNQLEKLKQAEIQIQNQKKLEEQEYRLQEDLKRIEQQRTEEKRQIVIQKAEKERQIAIQKSAEKRQNYIEKQQKNKQALIENEKARVQAYEDKLKAIELEEMRLDLEAKKARVNRTNDYIDHDLKQKTAQTDVIQSKADETRNISSGAKSFLVSSGNAQETESAKPIIQSSNPSETLYFRECLIDV